MLLSAALTTLATLAVYRLICLYRNYLSAKQIGLPIVVLPVSWQDLPWLLSAKLFWWIQYLPFGEWWKYSYMGWVLVENNEPHALLGPAFTLVTPIKNEIVLGTSDLIGDVMGKYKTWLRPKKMYDTFSIFGKGVIIVDGEDWQRQRKIVNHGFKEQNHKLVWESGIKQARQLCKSLDHLDMKSLKANLNTISANVLMYAGFGREYDFENSGIKDIPPGHNWSFAEAMNFLLNDVLFAWTATSLPRLPAMIEPKKLRTFRLVTQELQQYFEETVQSRQGDFVRALVEASENEKIAGSRQHLSDPEMYGNMFALNIAGFDTVAYTMQWALGLLAANPEVQDWVREEIDTQSDLASYDSSFSKTIRLRAVMVESLRVYGIAPNLVRISPDTQTLHIDGRDVVVPPMTYVSVSFPAAHSDPSVWGEDALRWTPKRWVEVADGKEELKNDPPMLAWVPAGPRVCPGKKFSQVEFCAVLSTILKEYKLQGSRGLQAALDDAVFGLTPKLKKPESVSINFIKC